MVVVVVVTGTVVVVVVVVGGSVVVVVVVVEVVVVFGTVVVVATVAGVGVLASDVDAQAGSTNTATRPTTEGTGTRMSGLTLAISSARRRPYDTVIRERFVDRPASRAEGGDPAPFTTPGHPVPGPR